MADNEILYLLEDIRAYIWLKMTDECDKKEYFMKGLNNAVEELRQRLTEPYMT